jgi:hypothetical protein
LIWSQFIAFSFAKKTAGTVLPGPSIQQRQRCVLVPLPHFQTLEEMLGIALRLPLNLQFAFICATTQQIVGVSGGKAHPTDSNHSYLA